MFQHFESFATLFSPLQLPELCLSWVRDQEDPDTLLQVAWVVLDNRRLLEHRWVEVTISSVRTSLLQICWYTNLNFLAPSQSYYHVLT